MARRVPAVCTLADRALGRGLRLRPRSRARRRLAGVVAVVAFLGPGLIAANAGNDAGGIATYSSVGARYGYALLWMMVVITLSLIVVQEMAARMGAVTGKGLAELIREQYGVRWSLFATTSVLIANVGRSEEHTSELQSHVNLVCRLLLEKKKTKQSVRYLDGLRASS